MFCRVWFPTPLYLGILVVHSFWSVISVVSLAGTAICVRVYLLPTTFSPILLACWLFFPRTHSCVVFIIPQLNIAINCFSPNTYLVWVYFSFSLLGIAVETVYPELDMLPLVEHFVPMTFPAQGTQLDNRFCPHDMFKPLWAFSDYHYNDDGMGAG